MTRYEIDEDGIEEIRTECAKRGQMDLFNLILITIGADPDYTSESSVSSEEIDDEPIPMGKIVREKVKTNQDKDGFLSLK